MAASPYTVSIPCPQCGRSREIGYYNRKQAMGRKCPACRVDDIRKHGMTETRLYHIWEGMRQRGGVTRCVDPKRIRKYAHVTVCEEWAHSFEAFRDWSLANGYEEDLTIDRKKGEMGYSPDNCRWADYTTQNRNRRHIVLDESKVSEIKWRLVSGAHAAALAAEYGVCKGLIDGISAGRDWADVEWPNVDPMTIPAKKHMLRRQVAAANARRAANAQRVSLVLDGEIRTP